MIRLAVRVRRADAELVLAELLALAPGGVEEREEGGVVEYAVYGAPGELPELPDLRAATGKALVEVRTSEVADDWDRAWRRFHQPVLVGGRLRVAPPWARRPEGHEVLEVVVDPGLAFGTGSHPTTRLCLELMLGLEPGGGLADLGCGSGVLAIAAAKLGWEPVAALDHDPESVAAARANAAVNGVALEVRRWDLRAEAPPHVPTIVANLLRPLLLELAARLERVPGRLIASGLLREEADEVAAAFAGHGLVEDSRREQGEWAALLMRSR